VFAGNLQVEVVQRSLHGSIYPHSNCLVIEQDLNIAEPEVLSSPHELLKVRDGKPGLVEELNTEDLETRGDDLWKKGLQVNADTPKGKLAEVRKCDVSCDRCM
jgi:hypothetical protein